MHELIQLQMFLDTPHNNDVQVLADMIQTPANLRDRNSRNGRRTQKLEHGKDLADITKDFEQLSSLYMVVYFCNEDWLECSGATVSRPLMMSLYPFFDTPC